MATTDEIIADVVGELGLPEGAVPLRIIVLCEYAEPGSDNSPERMRLATVVDDSLTPWASMGMLRFAEQLEFHAVKSADDDD